MNILYLLREVTKMGEYLENNGNLLVQVFAEFQTFLYLVQVDARNNEMLHKILLESKRIHIRVLCDFFSNSANNINDTSDAKCSCQSKRKQDDLYSADFVPNIPFDVKISSRLRQLISKGTAHLTRKRGSISVPDSDYIDACCSIIGAINRFMKELDRGNMSDLCRREIEDADAVALRQAIQAMLIRVMISNAVDGTMIDA